MKKRIQYIGFMLLLLLASKNSFSRGVSEGYQPGIDRVQLSEMERRMEVCFKNNKLDSVVNIANQILSIDSLNKNSLSYLATIYAKKRKFANFFKSYRKLIPIKELKPSFKLILFSTVFKQISKFDSIEKKEFYSLSYQLASFYREEHIISAFVGDVYRVVNKNEEAIEWYRNAASISPDSINYWINLMRVLSRAQHNEELMDTAISVCKRFHNDPKVLSWYGYALIKNERYEKADSVYVQLVTLFQDNKNELITTYNNLMKLNYTMKRDSIYSYYLHKLMELDPYDVSFLLSKMRDFYRQKDYQSFEELGYKIKKIEPDNLFLALYESKYLLDNNKFNEALNVLLSKPIDEAPTDLKIDIYEQLGSIYVAIKDKDNAATCASKVKKLKLELPKKQKRTKK